ncbi:hypothetical protein SORBI_3006G015250 [Sorghum bicolor]|uniref:Uncharacterized protein n=1 Tax=Sorghum bicolor TaxID=4558 RepID=A0A1Z5RBJ4_SORBI|nr:hypothetical protein SORBI_3006G015250 [Sorghum bicolor]
MLYAAIRCSKDSHAKQLGRGAVLTAPAAASRPPHPCRSAARVRSLLLAAPATVGRPSTPRKVSPPGPRLPSPGRAQARQAGSWLSTAVRLIPMAPTFSVPDAEDLPARRSDASDVAGNVWDLATLPTPPWFPTRLGNRARPRRPP